MRPLAAPVIAFILGIVVSDDMGFSSGFLFVLLALSLAAVLVAARRGGKLRPFLVVPPFFILGALFILPVSKPLLPAGHIVEHVRGVQGPLGLRVEAVVSSIPEARGYTTRLYVDAKRVIGDPAPPAPTVPTVPFAPPVSTPGVTGRIQLTLEGTETGLIKGDRVVFMSRLKEPRNFSNPGGFDYEWWLKRKGVHVTGYVREGMLVKVGEGGGLLSPIWGWRERLRAFIDSSELENRGVLKALVIGERGGIPERTREVFVRTGTAHILAISGLHVGLVAFFAFALILWLLKRSGRLMLALNVRRAALVLSLVPVLVYGALAGFSLPTQRAVIMVAALVATSLIDRERDLYNTVALAALAILLVSPGSVWDASFQLSFTAVLGIVYLVARLEEGFDRPDDLAPVVWRHWLVRKAVMLFFVSAAAAVATAPLTALYFNRVSLVGFITNLFVVPLVGFAAVPLALVSALTLAVWQGGAVFLLSAADAVIGVTVVLLEFFSSLPGSSAWVSTPTVFEIMVFYAIVVSLREAIRKRRLARFALPVLVVVLVLDMGYWHFRGVWDRDMKVTFISVGQGDSALVEFPPDKWGRRKTMLIDGGGRYGAGFDTGRMVVSPLLRRKKIGSLDYIVLSHPQRDHMGGLGFIAGAFSPDEFWWNGASAGGVETDVGRAARAGVPGPLGAALAAGGTKVVSLNGSTKPVVIDGVKVEFLHPPPESDLSGPNDNSLVLRLSYGKRSFLFTGDIGIRAEEVLLERDIRADVVKVPHHGGRTSSTAVFLDSVKPEIAVVSAGWRNSFGFPHDETLSRYTSRGISVLRTDLHGAVTISTDGERLLGSTRLTGRGR